MEKTLPEKTLNEKLIIVISAFAIVLMLFFAKNMHDMVSHVGSLVKDVHIMTQEMQKVSKNIQIMQEGTAQMTKSMVIMNKDVAQMSKSLKTLNENVTNISKDMDIGLDTFSSPSGFMDNMFRK